MIVEVKKTHIKKGKQNNANFCPIAYAIRTSLSASKVEVNQDTVVIGRTKLDLPSEAQNFIEAFDENKSSVQPFAFEL